MVISKNSKKKSFLEGIPTASIELDNDLLTTKCKFNFHYIDFSQKAGQNFEDWKKSQLEKLLDKLRIFSNEPLKYWQQQRAGSGNNHILEIYGNFPKSSKFVHPKKVPHQAQWARFRVGDHARLIGFVLPPEFEGKRHQKTKKNFDCNTFYVVFLDRHHNFYR